jgi:meiosis induction protein kinase IME2/SME1
MIQYPSSSHKTYECIGQLYGHPPSPGIDPQAAINPIFKVVSQALVVQPCGSNADFCSS